MKKRMIIDLVAISLLFISLIILQRLLMPKYITTIHEGNLVREYYNEAKKHEVIVIGDCEVFANISPITLWENYGITSYIRGSAQQLIWQSYYLLEDTLRYETPKVVVFNVLSMKYNEPQKEAYNRLTLDGMRFSKAKVGAIRASMLEEEDFITYIFPLLRYHGRWNELTREDFRYMFHKSKVSHNGYLMRVDIKPVTFLPPAKKLANYQFGKKSYDYLDRMTKLCKEKGIELVLIKSPSIYPHWYDEWDEQMIYYAKENDLIYINFLNYGEEIGLDYSQDTYDAGLHLNLSGAEKFSDYFGKFLWETYKLTDYRQDPSYLKIWEKKVKFYYEMKEHQEKELDQYGYLKSYGGQPLQ